MKSARMDEIEDLIAKAREELNHGNRPAIEMGLKVGHPLWGPVTCALRETLGEVHRLKAKLAEIARTTAREES